MTLLFLNSIGTGEFILIILVVLMLFGSKGVPDIVKNLGKGMREIKAASNEIKRDIQNSALEMRRDLNVPSIEELSKNTEVKEIENLVKIDEPLSLKSSDLTEVNDLLKLENQESVKPKDNPSAEENPKA